MAKETDLLLPTQSKQHEIKMRKRFTNPLSLSLTFMVAIECIVLVFIGLNQVGWQVFQNAFSLPFPLVVYVEIGFLSILKLGICIMGIFFPSCICYILVQFAFLGYIVSFIVFGVYVDQHPETYRNLNLMLSLPLVATAIESTLFHYGIGEKWIFSRSITSETLEDRTFVLWKILQPYFWPIGVCNRIRASLTYLVLGLSKAANLMGPLYLARATDALTNSNASLAIQSIAIYSCMVLSSKILKELQSLLYLRVKQTAYIENAQMTYRHLHSLSLEWHLKKKMGDVLRSMDRGVESANQVVSYLFLYLFPTIVESIIVLIIFSIHFELVSLANIGFIGLLLYSIFTVRLTLWRKKFREGSTKHDNAFHETATDALTNFETVKAFANEEYEIEKYTKAVRKYQEYSIWSQASLSLLNSSQNSLIQFTTFSALAYAIPFVISQDHGMNIGTFVAIHAYLSNLFAPLSFLGTIYNMVIKAYVDMQKLGELLSNSPDVVDAIDAKPLIMYHSSTNKPFSPSKQGASIEFRNVSFHYPALSYTNGLNHINFHIPSGTTTAIVGPTGAGKSTIARLLLRFYDVLDGEILINNQSIKQVTKKSLREAIGLVPQDTVLFHTSIIENIRYGKPTASFEEVVQATKDAQLYPFIEKLPEKWDTKVGERGLKLSGGEKQRLAIARMLLKDPSIILLDEATSALDSATEEAIQESFLTLRSKLQRTMVIIAHRLSTIQHSDQIIVLNHGKCLAIGNHQTLLDMKNINNLSADEIEGRTLYQRLWKGQKQQESKDKKS